MKRNVYTLASTLAALLLSGTTLMAQQAIPNRKPATPRTDGTVVPSGSITSARPDQSGMYNQPVAFADRIDSPIRWYALENAANDAYWNAVDVSRIWIELEIGVGLEDEALQAFLAKHELFEIIGESHAKDRTNFFIFENTVPSKGSVIAMAQDAQEITVVKFLEPSVIYTKHLVPNDPGYAQQWGPFVSYFDEAWNYGVGGNSLNLVCVMDDACDWFHEDLFDQVWYGYDYAEGDGDISPDDPTAHDHGTHVTGTVAAKINNGIGVAGMVNDTVYFAKVGTVQGTLNDQAINEGLYDIALINRIMAINMSLGGDAPSAALEQACNEVWNAGKIMLVSSGNNSMGFISYPAAYPACTAIGAIGADGQNLYLAPYSQYGPEQEVCGTGGDENTGFGILSTLPQNNYGIKQGTSMAAPHVTGLAGLLKNLNPNLTNVNIRNILASTAFDMGQPGWDPVYGFGLINAQGAAQAALGIVSSTADKEGREAFKIYPNPSSEFLLVDPKGDFTQAMIEVVDITGKVVMKVNATGGNKLQIDIREIPSGVYILRMTDQKMDNYSSRFVKI